MNSQKILIRLSFAVILLLASAGISMAAEITGDAYDLTCENMPDRAIVWKINGPDNLIIQSESTIISTDEPLPDGKYRFEVIGYLEESEIRKPKKEKSSNKGRTPEATPPNDPAGIIESGNFRIYEGDVVIKDNAEE